MISIEQREPFFLWWLIGVYTEMVMYAGMLVMQLI